MKNILILIVAFAVFLHFYPQPKLEAFYQEQKEAVLAAFSEATDTGVSLKLERVAEDINAKSSTFRKSEKAHAATITESKASVQLYYETYCKGRGKKDTKLHPNNQAEICRVLANYTSFMKK